MAERTTTTYVTCPCQHCAGHVEFDSQHIGTLIRCPHCGAETQLHTPAESFGLSPDYTPTTFHDFAGLEKLKARLSLAAAAAKQRGEALDHILLAGPQGSGRNTLAFITAMAMGASLRSINATAIGTELDLLGILCNLEEGDILLLNDIHLLQSNLSDLLRPTMEFFQADVTLPDSPPRPVRVTFPRFTIIATAPSKDRVSPKLLARFPVVESLPPYTPEELAAVAVRFASALHTTLEPEAAGAIAAAADGTPRDVLKFVRRIQGYALVKAPGAAITAAMAKEALDLFAPWEELPERRQLRENGATREPIPSHVRREVWRRDQGKCVRCGSREKLEFDHIVPVARGGSNTARNLELLCEACNRSKSASIQ